MTSEIVQKTCMGLAVAFIVAMIISALSRYSPIDLSCVGTVALATMALMSVVVQIGIGIWLFRRNLQNHPWLWLLLGVVFGLLALIVNLLIEISFKLDRPKN